MQQPGLVFSRRIRTTPFTSRVMHGGVKLATVYNHMVLASEFRSLKEDCEHLCSHVQVWDVSVQRQIQISGPDANKLVQWMTPRNLGKAQPDQCFYVPLCDENGGIVNDPIAINVSPQSWWLSISDSDVLLWAKGLAVGRGMDVKIREVDVWPIAIQGPKAETLVERVFGEAVRDIRFFRYKRLAYKGHDFIVARSGWSKQGGFEVYVDDARLGQELWDELFARGEDLNVGHGCPNLIERIESGLLSFGSDLDLATTPLQVGLDRFCHLDEDLDSMSLPALRAQREQGVPSRLMGLVVPGLERTVEDMQIYNPSGECVGELTSQVYSPRFNAWLGYALVERAAFDLPQLGIDANRHQAHVSELPFNFDQILAHCA